MLQTTPVQNTIRSALTGALIGVGLVFLYVLFQATQVYELTDMRALDQAQLARNLSRGEGYTTKLVRPLSLARVPQLGHHPDLVNAPLHPFLMSLAFRLLGPSSRVASWTSGLPFLLTIPLVLWLGWHTFSRRIGVLAAVATATNLGLLTMGCNGTEVALLSMLLTLLALILVYHFEREKQRPVLTLAAGAVTALLYLTNYLYLLALLPVVIIMALNVPPRRRFAAVVTFMAAYLVVCAPWMIRNFVVTRNPFYSASAHEMIMGTRTHPGNTLYRTFNAAPLGFVAFAFENPRQIYEKIHDAAMPLHPTLLTVAGVIMTPFFLVAILIPLGHVGLDRVRLLLYALMLLLTAALTVVMPDRTLLVPVVPTVTLVAAVLFYQLLDLRVRAFSEKQKGRIIGVAVTVLLVLHMTPVILQLAPGRANDAAQPARVKRACQELNSITNLMTGQAVQVQNDAVYTDIPWAVAWYSDRPAIWLPVTMVDVRRIEQAVGQVRWLVLTPQIANVAQVERAEMWADLWSRSLRENLVSPNWRVRQRFANGSWLLMERVPELASLGSIQPSAAAKPPQ